MFFGSGVKDFDVFSYLLLRLGACGVVAVMHQLIFKLPQKLSIGALS